MPAYKPGPLLKQHILFGGKRGSWYKGNPQISIPHTSFLRQTNLWRCTGIG